MNSPLIDDSTLEQVGFIKNGHSRLVYRPTLETKIRNGPKEVMQGEILTPQQVAQLTAFKQLSYIWDTKKGSFSKGEFLPQNGT
jgi:hypothetical protein